MTGKKRSDPVRAVTLEEAFERLEFIVQELEGGQIPLEAAIEMFVEGMKLVEFCQKRLDEAEQKVQKVIRETNQRWTVEAFNPGSDDDETQGWRSDPGRGKNGI
ncbi:exodeoxyribonuclease VII small subunit [Thermodesulforhabdus norvegica]|uniref:Exodeoxyribonuclease 7 small subunit n=1 Tax=Thermodesulforhabdus norvegica TaxID=39841 RepID=A0A1I4TA39_9BACT|nr:exodeoxyribonuclease VII small subunit [Thermodesulforhabdus norvegica]SFM73463.1 Exodeoxyribonuclease VII small subunit [Thermodesulforhabdus norvegica]